MHRGGSQSLYDPYELIFEGNFGASVSPPVSALVASDDSSGPGLDALTDFYATDGQVYTVWFTTAGAADYGTFEYTIDDGYGFATAAVHESPEAQQTPASAAKKLK